MTTKEFDQFEHEAHEYLKSQQEILKSKYKISGYDWYYDQDTGEFTFSANEIPRVIADFQVVGTLSTISNTWLWSWGNSSILENVKKDLQIVRQFGKEHNLRELVQPRWDADEFDAWAMTNVSARLLNAQGAYRCPDDNGFMFVIFTNVRRVFSE